LQPILAHQLGGRLQSRLQRTFAACALSWLHARQAISQPHPPPESIRGPPR
jgi:hypothetical protein